MFQENPSIFLADMGLPVVWGAYKTTGLLDMPGQVIAGGMVITTDYKLLYQTSALPGLDSNAVLTVNGVAYRVRDVRPMDTGVFSEAFLAAQ